MLREARAAGPRDPRQPCRVPCRSRLVSCSVGVPALHPSDEAHLRAFFAARLASSATSAASAGPRPTLCPCLFCPVVCLQLCVRQIRASLYGLQQMLRTLAASHPPLIGQLSHGLVGVVRVWFRSGSALEGRQRIGTPDRLDSAAPGCREAGGFAGRCMTGGYAGMGVGGQGGGHSGSSAVG